MIKSLDIIIWGREFSLSIDYDCDEDEEVLRKQIKALEDFVSHPEWVENAKGYVERFCRNSVAEDTDNSKKDNIFSYIKPDYIYVKRSGIHPRIALMCKYRYDMEHGLAVVFTADGNISVGLQDIIL